MKLDPRDLKLSLYELEQRFLRPSTRSSRDSLEELLDEDFVAFASSGGIFDRESTVSSLVLEQPFAWSIANFEARALADDVALVTYIATKSGGGSSLRSSIWRRSGGRWKMAFHQGTKIEK